MLGNLIDVVRRQAATYAARHSPPALTAGIGGLSVG